MNRMKLVGLMLVAAWAITATPAANAGASVFLSTVSGKLLSGALATQKFATKAGVVECTGLTAAGEVTALTAEHLKATVSYTGCKAFGLAATVSPAEYEFNASGTVTVLKGITIKATGCLVTVPGGQTVGTVKYLNKPTGEIEVDSNVTGITSSGTGAACEYETEHNGTYSGISLVAVEGGELTWDASTPSVFLSTVSGKLLSGALATQKFATKAGVVECTGLTAAGEVTALTAEHLKATVSYTGCKAFGLAATVSPAEYEFNASGTVTVLKGITIKATGCLVTVPGGQTVGTVKYLNKPTGEIEVDSNVTGITSSGTGAACEYETEHNGTYSGSSLVAVENGKLSWDA